MIAVFQYEHEGQDSWEQRPGRRAVTDETTDTGKHQHAGLSKAMIKEWGFVLKAMERRGVSTRVRKGMGKQHRAQLSTQYWFLSFWKTTLWENMNN